MWFTSIFCENYLGQLLISMKVQLDFTPERCTFYRNGDIHYNGLQVIITHRNFKNWEQLLTYLSQHVHLNGGAIRKVFDMKGNLIEEIKDFENNQSYVCSGGDTFMDMEYAKQHSIALVQKSTIQKEAKTESFFSQDSKGMNIYAQLNGRIDLPKKVILNYRNCKSLEQLQVLLTLSLDAHEPITFLMDYLNRAKITDMSQLKENSFIIACTRQYTEMEYKFPVQSHVADIPSPKIITVFVNGDPFDVGIRITVTYHKFKNVERLLEIIAHQLRDRLSCVNVLYGFLPDILSSDKANLTKGVAFSPKHVFKVKEMSELVDNQYYVAGSLDTPFRNIKYNIDSIESGLKSKLLEKQKNYYTTQISKPDTNVPISPQFEVIPDILVRKNEENEESNGVINIQ
eukprot:NODE_72_length_23514_cov_0.560624.p5 type:complete len:400 gc:universal NODE_72_length_23514_cov_0.560624:3902-5101(+)